MRQTKIYPVALLLAPICLLLLVHITACFDYFDWSDDASPALNEDNGVNNDAADNDVDNDVNDDEDDDEDDDEGGNVNDDVGDDDDTFDDDDTQEVWEDSISGLMWQNLPYVTKIWLMARIYCTNLSLGGNDDWRLPSISELRSLVRGCEAVETGGSCGVTDWCLEDSCEGESCDCYESERPANGCFWPSQLSGECSEYWSSSEVLSDDPDDDEKANDQAWTIDYYSYGVKSAFVSHSLKVRCVR